MPPGAVEVPVPVPVRGRLEDEASGDRRRGRQRQSTVPRATEFDDGAGQRVRPAVMEGGASGDG